MKQRWTKFFVGFMLVALVAIGIPSAASAEPATTEPEFTAQGWPTGCSTGPVNNGAYATCSASNGGHYRAIIICEDWYGQKINRSAPNWLTSGYSVVYCPPLTDRIANGIESRAY